MMNNIYLKVLVAGLIFLIKPVYSLIESPAVNSIEVEIISVEKIEELIENRNGKPLLINVWATWCAPCREEFPDLVKLAKEYDDKIDVVGISVDYPEEIDSKIIPFLKKHNSSFINYVVKVKEPEDFINLLSKDWSGAIPATFIYNENREQIKYLIGKQSFEEFEKAINSIESIEF